MKVGEFTDAVRALIYNGVPSDDAPLGNRIIFYHGMAIRNLLIAKNASRGMKAGSPAYQTIYVTMEDASDNLCNISGCNLLTSTEKIPTVLSVYGPLIDYVETPSGQRIGPATETSHRTVKYRRHKAPYYFISNDYLYVSGIKTKFVRMRAVFTDLVFGKYCMDPSVVGYETDLQKIEDCTSALDMDFPCPEDLTAQVIDLTAQKITKLIYQNRLNDDLQNDARPSGPNRQPAG